MENAVKGLGVDIVDVSRIADMVTKYGDRFIDKVFTPSEAKYCRNKANPGIHFAARWAAKEAFYKALSSICQGVATWKSIETLPAADGRGRPEIHVLSKELRLCMAAEGIDKILVSISHEKLYCVAHVLLASSVFHK